MAPWSWSVPPVMARTPQGVFSAPGAGPWPWGTVLPKAGSAVPSWVRCRGPGCRDRVCAVEGPSPATRSSGAPAEPRARHFPVSLWDSNEPASVQTCSWPSTADAGPARSESAASGAPRDLHRDQEAAEAVEGEHGAPGVPRRTGTL